MRSCQEKEKEDDGDEEEEGVLIQEEEASTYGSEGVEQATLRSQALA